MALEDIKQKILAEAQAAAEKTAAAAAALAKEKLSAAQKQLRAERQKAETALAKEREQALRQHSQMLALEAEQRSLALKRECLQEVLALAVERITRRHLEKYYTKILRDIDFNGARLLAGGDTAPVKTACQAVGLSPEIVPQKNWPAGRLEVDYGRARLNCSLGLYAQELARTSEAELAERLWP